MRRLSATLVMLAVAGCASTPPPPVVVAAPQPILPPGPPPPTIERTWRLAYLFGAPESLPTTPTLTLAVDAAKAVKASGFGGCGEYSGPGSLQGISLRFEGLTPAAHEGCNPDAKTLETQFVATLADIRRVTIRSGYLVLIDLNGRDRAYFTPG